MQKFRKQLEEIAAQQVDGKFVDEKGEVYAGNESITELLNRCNTYIDIVLEK